MNKISDYPQGSGSRAASGSRSSHAPDPSRARDADIKTQFAVLTESAFLNHQSFAQLLSQAIEDEWQMPPEMFRSLLIRCLDDKLEKLQKRKDYDPDTLSYAMKRYIKERGALLAEEEDDDIHITHPVVPSPNTISNWMNGRSKPDGSQVTLLAEALDLSLKQEHMLWKSLQGKPLSMHQIVQAIHSGHSGAVTSLLARSSGFSRDRLAEIIGIPQPTISAWIDSRTTHHRIYNKEAATRFANLLTQCLDANESELKAWRVSAIRRDIVNLMSGRDLQKCPSSPKEAAARFQLLMEDSFAQNHSFDQFLRRVTQEWQVPHNYLTFINDNNAAIPSYEPIDPGTFNRWVNGTDTPRVSLMGKIVSGTFMDEQQELMLWKMSYGKPITVSEVRSDISAGSSAVLLNHLIEASGIAHDRILSLAETHTGNLQTWRNEKKPYKMRNTQQARKLAQVLLAHIDWEGHLPTAEQSNQLCDAVVESFTGRAITQSLFALAVEAAGHEAPHGRLMQLLTSRLEMSNPDTAKELGISVKVLSDLKGGNRTCTEDEALRFIDKTVGRADAGDIVEAVNILTQTRSPSEMLKLAEQGKAWIGKVIEETRKRRHMSRNDVHKLHNVATATIDHFENEGRARPVGLAIAQKLADYVGFTGDERRRFIIMATGRQITPISAILEDAENLRSSEQETMNRLCEQTGLFPEEIAQFMQIPAQEFNDYCAGQQNTMEFPLGSLDSLAALCQLKPGSHEVERLYDIFQPGPLRRMLLASVGKMDRTEVLGYLMDAAHFTDKEKEHLGITSDIKSLRENHALSDILATIGERLHLDAFQQDWLKAMYDTEHLHDDAAFVQHMESYRRQLIGHILSGAMEHTAHVHRIYHERDSHLSTFDSFMGMVSSRDARPLLQNVRYFLANDTRNQRIDNAAIENSFRIAASYAGSVSPPAGSSLESKEWHSIIFETTNILLFQKLDKCRDRLGIKGVASNGQEARQQRRLLLADEEGRNILTAVMAFNNGMIARKAKKLLEMPQFKDDQDSLLKELWLGRDTKGEDVAGGGLEVFLKWDPTIARLSTYMERPMHWRVNELWQEVQEQAAKEKSGILGPVDADQVSMLDDVAYRQYSASLHENHADPDEVLDLMGKISKALSLLPPRERALLEATFEGIRDGKTPTLEELIPVVTGGSKTETLTRERVRQLRVSAYNKFMDAWEVIAGPDDEMPVSREVFLEHLKDCDNDNIEVRKHGAPPHGPSSKWYQTSADTSHEDNFQHRIKRNGRGTRNLS